MSDEPLDPDDPTITDGYGVPPGAVDEAAGLGQADPVTGVTGAGDDLSDTAELPESDAGGGASAEEGADPDPERESDAEYSAAVAGETVTTDAVAGETVLPGPGDGNDGPTGGAPTEEQPELPRNELDPTKDVEAEPIDLRDEA